MEDTTTQPVTVPIEPVPSPSPVVPNAVPKINVTGYAARSVTSLVHYQKQIPFLLIRIGLVFVYSYAAISMSIHPSGFVHYIPTMIEDIIKAEIALKLFAVYEILLSIWLLSGKKPVYSAALATVTIFGITATNTESFNIVFRNVSIFFSALALTYMEVQESRVGKKKNV